MATIKAIQDNSVHQIQSGQVIVDLCSVVKELVENSLDAGASSIDVRFKNQGLESIEVQDNGNGIASEDYETIALKHYTSKLSSYEDLDSLHTFGFRGEALSSLCALSDFHVVTARASAGAKGTKLDFETSGKLKGTSVVAAQKGTTVAVENLFKNLPVRRKELEKNVKREYGKVLALLHAYACISTGVRIAVSSQMSKGKKVAVFATKSNPTTKENITNVFGAKTILALVKLDLHLEMEPSKGPTTQSARNWQTQHDVGSRKVLVQGHISRPVFGEGRQAPDRQMFYVNSRPCALPQISKAFNEVYKSFNVSQTPFIFANLIMDANAYDVNVSPDKRTILLHDQANLLESLKASLTELFEAQEQSVPQSQLVSRKLPAFQPLNVTRTTPVRTSVTAQESMPASSEDDERSEASSAAPDQIPQSPGFIHEWAGRDTEARNSMAPPKRTTSHLLAKKEHLALSRTQCDSADDRDTDSNGTPESNENGALDAPNLIDAPGHDAMTTFTSLDEQPQSHPLSSVYNDLSSQQPAHLPRAVQDFNARIQSQRDKSAQRTSISGDAVHVENRVPFGATMTEEEAIPAMATHAQKSTPGAVQSAFDHMRPKRAAEEIAHVTIGNTTTTMVLGTPQSKRRRVHTPKDTQSIAKFGASPLLARSLRAFAAPGTPLADVDGDNADMADAQAEELESTASEEESLQPDTEDPMDISGSARPDAATSDERHSSSDAERDSQASLSNLMPRPFVDADSSDDEYLDEEDKKMREDAKIARMIQEAEEVSARPTEGNLKRASQVLKASASRKDATFHLVQTVDTSCAKIEELLHYRNHGRHHRASSQASVVKDEPLAADDIAHSDAEARLALTVSKADFSHMRIVGQFNLGFVLAVRPSQRPNSSTFPDSHTASDQDGNDHLFIIDQHAADEKYNFERLTQTTTLQPQRLVQPKPLELTAIEEEIILAEPAALAANGFSIQTDMSGDVPVGRRCSLLTLPTSKETTFTLSDLEELLHLLSESASSGGGSAQGHVAVSTIARPTKVRRMLAMRACRSSIMVGKTLTQGQMQKVVRHMGEMEKPWNCPHGRPTMRHLAGLGAWKGWKEGADEWGGGTAETGRGTTDWVAWMAAKRNKERA